MNDSYISFVNLTLRRIAPETCGRILAVWTMSDLLPTALVPNYLLVTLQYLRRSFWRRDCFVCWRLCPVKEDVEHQLDSLEA